MLVELRIGGGAKGAQTVAPGSIHESGEEIKWEVQGVPAITDGDELERFVRLLGALALMTRYWPAKDSHARHHAALVVGGFLSRAGYRQSFLREYVGAIAKAAGDEEWKDRRKAAEDQAIAHGAAGRTYGYPALAETFGKDLAEKVAEWLDYEGDIAPKEPEPTPSGYKPRSRTRAEVHEIFQRWVGPEYDLDTLDAVLAVAASEQLPGDPAWLLIIAGSGNAKTETAQSLGKIGARVVSTISSDGALISASSRRAKDATGEPAARDRRARHSGDQGFHVDPEPRPRGQGGGPGCAAGNP